MIALALLFVLGACSKSAPTPTPSPANKTGKPRPSDSVQVMVCMYAVPRSLRQYQGVTFNGLVVYKNHEVAIPSTAADQTFINKLGRLVRRVSANEPACKVPTPMECGFCDVAHTDCLEHATVDNMQEGITDDF